MPDPFPAPDAADLDLVHRAAHGDGVALGALYDRFAPTLYSVAVRLVREHADADAVLLEAFAQAWRDAPRFNRARGSVAAWLTMIVRSRALDLVRSRSRRDRAVAAAGALDVASGVPWMGGLDDGPSSRVIAGERRRLVLEAMQQLPVAQREVLELAYFHGLSQSQIAAQLEEPLGTVKTRIRAGMQKLRELLRTVAD